MVTRDIAEIIDKISGYKSQFVATNEKHPDAFSPGEVFKKARVQDLFIVTWGPLVEKHIKLIQKNVPDAYILYYAQSFGWNIKIPPRIPIVCVSKYVMAQWALHATENFCTQISPPLHAHFSPQNGPRNIDILAHKRKQNKYCLEKLLPALQKESLRVEILDDWIPQEKFAELLNRTKIFLYITELHKAGWGKRLPGEGFGLPALEAVACGAVVGSNLLGGVTDFLTPGENCLKLQNGNLGFDIAQIKHVIDNFTVKENAAHEVVANYSLENVTAKWKFLLQWLYETFFFKQTK